jgi:DNA (cytosine-5)-methyltransferase 1
MQINPSLESGGKQPYQQNRIYDENGISPALCANKSDLLIKEATAKGFIEIQPGECFDFENPNSNTRRGRKMDDKSNCLMATETKFMQYTYDYRIRRLTPRECMRLQTVPEHLIDKMMDSGISDTQLYRMAGNGWTIDVIAYIISHAS